MREEQLLNKNKILSEINDEQIKSENPTEHVSIYLFIYYKEILIFFLINSNFYLFI